MSSTQTMGIRQPGQSWRESLDLVERSVCTSCGADTPSSVCFSCGRPLGLGPTPLGGPTLGDIYVHKRLMLKQQVVRIGRGSPVGSYVSKNGKVLELADKELSGPVGSAPAFVPGYSIAAGLVSWIAGMRRKTTDYRFPEHVLAAAAIEATSIDLFQARRLGQDLVLLGLTDLIHDLALPEQERAWLALVGAARWDDHGLALRSLATLPSNGYRAKIKLLARLWPWLQPLQVSDLLARHVAPFASGDPLASALHVLLGAKTSSSVASELVESLSATLPIDEASHERMRTTLQRVRGQSTPGMGSRVGAADRVLEALDPHGIGDPPAVSDVAGLALPLLDDLIDLHRFPEPVVTERSDNSDREYLQARLNPACLDDSAVDRLSFAEEKIRRALIRGDAKTLDAHVGTPMAAHAQTLLAIRMNRHTDVDIAAVEPIHRLIIGDLLALLDAAQRGEDISSLITPRLAEDVSVWEVIQQSIAADQFHPSPGLTARHTAFMEWFSLATARELLYLGQWWAAAASARSCLEVATDEAVRDEALNLLACALFQVGEDEAAIAALEKALEGEYSAALLANIGVVAASLHPELAAKHLGKLVDEAPTVELKLAAVRRIVAMWSSSDATGWESGEVESEFPVVVRDPVRAVFVAPIPLEDFRELGTLLSRCDASWLASANLTASPHVNTLEARLCVARARGLGDLVTVMASVTDGETAPAWFDREIVDFGSWIVDELSDDLVHDSTERPGLAELALSFSDRVQRLDPVLDAKLVFGGTALLLDCFWQDDTAASDVMAGRLGRGRALLADLDPQSKEALQPLSALAHKKLGLNYALASVGALQVLIEQVNALADQIRSRPDAVTMTRKRNTSRQLAESCAMWRERISRLVPYVTDDKARNVLQTRVDEVRRIEAEAWGMA